AVQLYRGRRDGEHRGAPRERARGLRLPRRDRAEYSGGDRRPLRAVRTRLDQGEGQGGGVSNVSSGPRKIGGQRRRSALRGTVSSGPRTLSRRRFHRRRKSVAAPSRGAGNWVYRPFAAADHGGTVRDIEALAPTGLGRRLRQDFEIGKRGFAP